MGRRWTNIWTCDGDRSKEARLSLVKSISYLMGVLASIDLRDNLIDDAEMTIFAEALSPRGVKLSKLALAGNRIRSAGLASLAKALSIHEEFADGSKRWRSCNVTELDLSRNRLAVADADLGAGDASGGSKDGGGKDGSSKDGGGSCGEAAQYEGLDELARSTANSNRLSILTLKRTGLDDAAAAAFFHGLHTHAPRRRSRRSST